MLATSAMSVVNRSIGGIAMSKRLAADMAEQLLRPPEPAVFAEAECAGLPGPVRRYLRASIA